jgi:hypothetical protein
VTTARTLAQAAVGWIVLGLVIGSPAGSTFLYALGALFALPSMLLARGHARVFHALILGAALFLLAVIYPEYREHMARWTNRQTPVESVPETP